MSHHIPSVEETARLLEEKRSQAPKQRPSTTQSQQQFMPHPARPYTPWVAPYDVLYRHELRDMFDQSQNHTYASATIHGGGAHLDRPTMDVVVRTPHLAEGDEGVSIHLSLDLSLGLQDVVRDAIVDAVDQAIAGTLTSLISRCHG